jgi:hypothetical protein
MLTERNINALAIVVIAALSLWAYGAKADTVVLVDAAVTLDCAATPADTLDCIMREDGIVTATCEIAHNGTAVCWGVF